LFVSRIVLLESSLDDLDLFAAEISKQIAEIDDEISEVVQMQSLAGRQLTKVLSYRKLRGINNLSILY
jgi:hypothetical protein